MLLNYYLQKLDYKEMPRFMEKYLSVPSLLRLKNVSYFCGMDYASKDIYKFRETISRYDHSLTCALLTYKLTGRSMDTLAALFHDISTPCFSHVIDYMNKDYNLQESTEEYTEEILKNDSYFINCIKKDKIALEDIANFKKYPIVDNERPKLCTDRIDGIILPGISWTKHVTKEDIVKCIDALEVYTNEENDLEVGFNNLQTARRMVMLSDEISKTCMTNEDNYMMILLSKITKLAIKKGLLNYKDLYYLNEVTAFDILEKTSDKEIKNLLNTFKTITKKEIPTTVIENIKVKRLNPLVNGHRLTREN